MNEVGPCGSLVGGRRRISGGWLAGWLVDAIGIMAVPLLRLFP